MMALWRELKMQLEELEVLEVTCEVLTYLLCVKQCQALFQERQKHQRKKNNELAKKVSRKGEVNHLYILDIRPI